jgi:hypothetical protein
MAQTDIAGAASRNGHSPPGGEAESDGRPRGSLLGSVASPAPTSTSAIRISSASACR